MRLYFRLFFTFFVYSLKIIFLYFFPIVIVGVVVAIIIGEDKSLNFFNSKLFLSLSSTILMSFVWYYGFFRTRSKTKKIKKSSESASVQLGLLTSYIALFSAFVIFFIVIGFISVVFLSLIGVDLGPPNQNTVNQSVDQKVIEEKLIIESGTQATYKELKIGVGNFWEENYTDTSGVKKKGLTAGLWIYPKVGKEYTRRVYQNEEFTFGGYKFKVAKVISENGKGSIELVISSDK